MKLWIKFSIIWAMLIVVVGLFPRKEQQIIQQLEIISEPDTLSIENPSWVLPEYIDVIVTVYHAVESQTDDTPHILADGTKIDIRSAGSYRYCALSRDLLSRWGGVFSYGDTVYVEGAEHLSGPWIVKDTMNKRWTNRVDLLVDVDMRPYKFETAKLRSL